MTAFLTRQLTALNSFSNISSCRFFISPNYYFPPNNQAVKYLSVLNLNLYLNPTSKFTGKMDSDSLGDGVVVQSPDTSRVPDVENATAADANHRGVTEESGGAQLNYERKVLPEELSRSVVVLSCESSAEGGYCDVFLVGTAHVSQESCREVEAVVSYLKPQVVFLELCSNRVAILSPQNLKGGKYTYVPSTGITFKLQFYLSSQIPTMKEMLDSLKKKQNIFGVLYSWFLAKVASQLEVFPGAEFRVAFEEAMKYGGKVILGDRPVNITLRRTWAKMPLWHKTKILYSLVFQAFFLPSAEVLTKMLKDMDDADMLTLVIQEMSKEFPTLMETLVHERDLYMSSTLLRTAREHSSVVAVVGKGHLQGIKKHWEQPVEVRNLMEIPSSKRPSVMKVILSTGAIVAGLAIISGIYTSTKDS